MYIRTKQLTLAEEIELRMYNIELKIEHVMEKQNLLEERIKLMELDLEDFITELQIGQG